MRSADGWYRCVHCLRPLAPPDATYVPPCPDHPDGDTDNQRSDDDEGS